MKTRDYNVDLFRVLATIFVIILHVLGQGGILESASPGGAKYWVAWSLEILAYCAVNCFALISGYVMVNKTTRLRNIISTWFTVLFYSVLITGLFFLFVPETRSIKELVYACVPVIRNQWWYVSSYFALFAAIPILNAAVHNISQTLFKKLLLVILIAVCIIDCGDPNDPFVLSDGYSPIWLMILYLFGGYIRKYDVKEKVTALKSAGAFWVVILLTVLSKFCIYFVTKKIFGEAILDNTFVSYTSVTIVLASVFLFLYCLNVKISNFSRKAISLTAPATFGVYLIHVHPMVFDYIVKDAFADFVKKNILIMILCVFVATALIFFLCTAIDLIRIQFFKLIKVDRWSEKIEEKTTALWLRVFKA